MNTTCPLCARPRPADATAWLGWSSQHEPDGSLTRICLTCTRAQLWLIETAMAVATPLVTVPRSRAA